ncbi:hypothetical protein JRQ81_010097 [Phrynocephalus forsythii]|uniref:Uncharacterized protein n=1 Tax=Phrynocephalus forsythii TaxID=171643 RepID=A0A9Q0X7W3_9SAUR|nr:hypothetical protein JRQ81_010097 [Phrynocephalus forsythii]
MPKGDLYSRSDPAYWRAALDLYPDAVKAKGHKQRNLLALDKWYQEELPMAITQRKEKYLTKEELVKLMEWKLTRGKFRPRLQQLVATNASQSVEDCTRKAFELLPDVAAAVKELSKLKAVGPATASAILAAGAPEAAAFMADEAVESIPGLAPVQYTLQHYLLYLDQVQSCVERLNRVDKEKTWTPHLVERCLWASAVADKLRLPSLQILDGAKEEAGHDDTDGARRARKKQRTE